MTSAEIIVLRAENPKSDIDALLGMEDKELSETVSACHAVYDGEDSKPQSREAKIRAVLRMRDRFAAMPPAQRKANWANEKEEAAN